MSPQEIRNLRLKNDYREMVNIKGEVISWEVLKGTPPYVESYKVTLNIKGVIGEGPRYRDTHVVHVTMPANYPKAAPDVRMKSTPFVYHPNWYKDGKWCFGTWLMSEGLGHHVTRMARTIQYDTEITNEKSPANRDANAWYKSKKRKGLFPCDTKTLPDPTKDKISFGRPQKKKFDIN
ncbi:ubiquitin-conjugating enzyme E2 [uncultured Psychroserpens sp.]|uniref:ubiquitin-conjugating enzyme E2 n=1 Tax=uncultured Psychroserpens sp. TaxID=255436 RepID=UPI00262358EA|nr:ubiquitin-conjugating enzyme E2 [uncultured Psychroserpens sp.]